MNLNCDFGGVNGLGFSSEVQRVGEQGKDAVRCDDGRNPGYYSLGRGLTYGGGAVTRLHTPKTPGVGHQESKERPLADPQQEPLELDRLDGAGEVHGGGDVQQPDGHTKPPGDPVEI